MIRLNKKNKILLSMCTGVVAIAIFGGCIYWFFSNDDDHELLDVTKKCITTFEKEGIYISDGEQNVSFDQLEFAVTRNSELTNGVQNEYHKKYNTLLKQKKPFYALTDEECYELNFSAGTNEVVLLAQNDILQSGKSIQIWSEGDYLRYSFVENPSDLNPPPMRESVQ